MSGDRRPTREELKLAWGYPDLVSEWKYSLDELLARTERAGFIKPEPRPNGWYRVRRRRGGHPLVPMPWACARYADGHIYICGDPTLPADLYEFGERISMPDDKP